jgi:hypothetical protein
MNRAMRPRKPAGVPGTGRRAPTPSAIDQRTGADRRSSEDRREMPPRPEGRRRSGGRRKADPEEA